MNLRKYYQSVQQIQESLPEGFVHVTSLATPSGGREGVVNEVERENAARMIADGVARRSTEEEVQGYRDAQAEAQSQLREEELRNRLRITLLSEPEFQTEGDKGEARPRTRK